MNIEEYRALKAREKEEAKEPIVETQEEPEQLEEEPETKEEETKEEKPEDDFVEIEGEKIKLSELKNGYLRQSDYTKKTQQLANEKKDIEEALRFYEDVKNNPQAVQSLSQNINVPRKLDPSQAHVARLEEELYDMKLDNEINLMQSKYEDFDVREVLNYAASKDMTNLEDAYVLLNASKGTSHETSSKPADNVSMDELKAELKAEIISEMKGKNTGSIISGKGSARPVEPKEVKLTSGELKVATGMGLSAKEYSTWRDANK